MSKDSKFVTVLRKDLEYWLYQGLLMEAYNEAGVDNWSAQAEIDWPDEETDALDLMDKLEAKAERMKT